MQTLLILPISFLLNIFVYRFKIDIFNYIKIPIEKLQSLLKDNIYKNNQTLEFILGIIVSLIILSISFIIPYFLFYFLYKVHFLLGIIIELVAAYIIIGIRKPFEVSSSIYSSIKYTNLDEAKNILKENTNIDVDDIDRENIIKKTIEYSSISVAEDYIYTSIFFLLGGVPLCFMYKILCMLSDISSDNNVSIDENRVKDKFEKSGMHAVKSERVDAPIIEEYPITLECKVSKIYNDDEGFRVVGEIVNVLADEEVLDSNGKVDPTKLNAFVFDQFQNGYYAIGEKVGEAWKSGNKYMK